MNSESFCLESRVLLSRSFTSSLVWSGSPGLLRCLLLACPSLRLLSLFHHFFPRRPRCPFPFPEAPEAFSWHSPVLEEEFSCKGTEGRQPEETGRIGCPNPGNEGLQHSFPHGGWGRLAASPQGAGDIWVQSQVQQTPGSYPRHIGGAPVSCCAHGQKQMPLQSSRWAHSGESRLANPLWTWGMRSDLQQGTTLRDSTSSKAASYIELGPPQDLTLT